MFKFPSAGCQDTVQARKSRPARNSHSRQSDQGEFVNYYQHHIGDFDKDTLVCKLPMVYVSMRHSLILGEWFSPKPQDLDYLLDFFAATNLHINEVRNALLQA